MEAVTLRMIGACGDFLFLFTFFSVAYSVNNQRPGLGS